MGGVAQAGDILRYQDIVYAQQWPDRAEGAAEAGACLFKGVLPFLCQSMVGVRHWGVVEVSAYYGLMGSVLYVAQNLVNLFRTLDECHFHLFVGIYNIPFQFVAGDFLA